MVVLAISFILTVLLLMFIVPQFAEMYAENQAGLPTFTAILLHISAGCKITLAINATAWVIERLIALPIFAFSIMAATKSQIDDAPAGDLSGSTIFSADLFLPQFVFDVERGHCIDARAAILLPQQKSWQASPALSGDILLTEWIGRKR